MDHVERRRRQIMQLSWSMHYLCNIPKITLLFLPQHWIYDMKDCFGASKQILLKHLKDVDTTKAIFERLYSLKKSLNKAINKASAYMERER